MNRTWSVAPSAWLSVVLLTGLASTPANAQEVAGAEGPTTRRALGDGPRRIESLRRGVVARSVRLPALDAKPFLDEDAVRASMPALKYDPRVAVMRQFHRLHAPARFAPGVTGVEVLADGSLVWSAELSAPGALGLRMHVARCDLPDDAEVFVYDADEPSEAYGPFVDGGPDGTDEFLLPTVFAQTVRVEVRVPAAAAGRRVRFAIDRVAQRYRDQGEGLGEPRVGSEPKSGNCNNNVACDASYVDDVARAVATMEITAIDGVYLCSGSLLNDSDLTTTIPYFLTAHHCLSSESEARNTEFYFDYRSSTCSGTAPLKSSVPRVAGSTLLATSSSSDFTLLRLTGTLPSNRFFCGWTASRQNAGIDIVGVHHPGGLQMRISYGSLVGSSGNFDQVQWSSGVTAGGSSGSPLFNPQKQVIGQLYGGSSSCADQQGIDEYGRFDRSYPSMAQFLGAGTDSASDPYDPTDDTVAGATLLTAGLRGGAHGPHTLSKDDLADWFAFDLDAGSRYRFFSTGLDDVRATLYSDDFGAVVEASDDDSGGTGQFSIDFTPSVSGRYRLAVRTGGALADAEYVLEFSQVNPKSTRVAAAVQRLRKRVVGGNVTLRWLDRARNEAGYFVDVSDDAGAHWRRAAELPQRARTYKGDPGPGRHLYRVAPWNVAAELRWREIAVEVFDANEVDALDPDDDGGSGATLLTPTSGGATAVHSLSRADAEDWFKIQLAAGTRYTFATTGSLDTRGDLFDDAGGFFFETSDDDAGPGRNFRLVFLAPRTDTFWLRVAPSAEGDVGTYVLQWQEE